MARLFYDIGKVAAASAGSSRSASLERDFGIGFRFGHEQRRLPPHRRRIRQPAGAHFV
jgi:hypothetical protein